MKGWRRRMNVLLTGGAGYIGSHTAVELIEAGHNVIIVDDFSNSNPKVLGRLREITRKDILCYEMDVADELGMDKVFEENKIDAVIHFAGFKAVGESVRKPLEYYENNLKTTFNLIHKMKKYDVKNLVFSSSATVYGLAEIVPLKEEMPTWCTNPYGWTKFMNERILMDISNAMPELSIVLLRYFNPIGAHHSGLIGENPNGIPNNLMPYISQVAVGKLEKLNVFGNDYETKDGTGVRDYIHVVDLARGHVKAIEYANENKGVEIFNLGTGVGYSVLEMVEAFKKVNEVDVPYEITARRPGDIAVCYADSSRAKEKLGWIAEKNLEDMCRDTWNWQKNNPLGYESN